MKKLRRIISMMLIGMSLTFASSVVASEYFELGTPGGRGLSLEQERELGNYFITVARSQLPVITDPVLNQYLEGLVGRLALRAQGTRFPFEPFWVRDNSINAAAFFGGKIMVHTGVILVSETESELSSVIAHEMYHVIQRHLARSIEEKRANLPGGVMSIVGSLILAVINPALGAPSLMASMARMQQADINIVRANEYEADRLAVDLLAQTGFNPRGMGNMMRHLRAAGGQVNPAFEMLIDHPAVEKRIADADNRAMSYKVQNYYESPEFLFAKARIMVRYSGLKAENLLQEADKRLLTNAKEPFALYLKALAALELKKMTEAQNALEQLKPNYGQNLFYLDTMSDFLIAEKRYAEAEKMLLEGRRRLGPDNEVIAANLAALYLEMKRYNDVVKVVRKCQTSRRFALGDEFLIKTYRAQRNFCGMYMVNIASGEYAGKWDQALYSANEALRTCDKQDDILKVRAWMGRLAESRSFYEHLLDNVQ